MPEIELFDDKTAMVGKRRKGRDESIEDAMKTMERFSDWLVTATEQDIWRQADAINTAMLYGMLMHLSGDIQELLARGGAEARATFEFFQGMKRDQAQTPPSPGARAEQD